MSSLVVGTKATPIRKRPSLRAFAMSTSGRVLIRLLILALCLLAWQYGAGPKVQFWTSTPAAIAKTLFGWIVDGSLWIHLSATLTAMVIGYAIGCATGIVCGLLLGFFPHASRLLNPYITAFYALPKIALAPLLVILLGIGIESKVALVATTVFFLLLNSTLDGMRDVDGDIIQLFKLMGANGREIAYKVVLPATLPWIFTGMRISVRYAFTATLLAELIAANRGLGYLIVQSSGNFDSTGAYAAIVVVVIFSVSITELLSQIEHRLSAPR